MGTLKLALGAFLLGAAGNVAGLYTIWNHAQKPEYAKDKVPGAYTDNEANAVAIIADTNNDGVLQSTELAKLLRDTYGWKGVLPDNTPLDLKVNGSDVWTRYYALPASRLEVKLPKDATRALIAENKELLESKLR